MQNQIYIGDADRRKVVRILLNSISATEFDTREEGVADIVTDEMIAKVIHPKQTLNLTMMWGRPLHVTERDRVLDLRDYMEHIGGNPEAVVRKINQQIRDLTGMKPM